MTGTSPQELQPDRKIPRTSVILIFYQSAPFIAEAIESVLRQSDGDWELILVDDGSTDGSTEIARAFVQRDVRIAYAAHPGRSNHGISASRNLGSKHARGDYLVFLDSDDVWVDTKIEEQLALFQIHPEVDAVLGALRYWFSWDPHARQPDRVVLTGNVADRLIEPPEAMLDFYPLGTAPGASVDIMIRRTVFEALGGFDDRFPGMYEDQILLSKLYLRHKIYVSSRPWLQYRQHADSCTAQAPYGSPSYHAHRAAFLNWLDTYLANQSDKPSAAVHALRKARRAQRIAAIRALLASAPRRAWRRLGRWQNTR